MQMPTFGPMYCETAGYIADVFPAEPVNTFSNTAILFGIASFYLVIRRTPRAADLYLAAFLLLANGVGSFLWHGTRERWALTFDVWPGVAFLMVMVFLWARRIAPIWLSVPIAVGFYYLTEFLRSFSVFSWGGGWGRWTSMAPAVIFVGSGLVARTYQFSKRAAGFGALSLVLAIAGLAFRILDSYACSFIPFGSHFLWHICLSTGAFFGMLTLIELEELGARTKRSDAAPHLAESPAE